MWLLQTPIEGLVLPTDSEGHLTLGGQVPAWHHIVRGREPDADGADAWLAASDVEWEVRPWYEAAGKIYFHGAIGAHGDLLERVRGNRHRPMIKAAFPEAGRRRVDRTVQLLIIVPPEFFAQYESLVRLAMTLPVGMVALTVPIPLIGNGAEAAHDSHRLLAPGHTAFVSGCELVVSRATASVFSADQIGRDQRTPQEPPAQGAHLDDDGYSDWFHFRRADDDRG